MKKTYWNITAIAAAVSMALCSCSAEKTSENGASAENSSPKISGDPVTDAHPIQTADEILSDSYKSTPISVPEDLDYVSTVDYIPDKKYFMVMGSSTDSENMMVYRFSEDLSSYEKITPEMPPETQTADNFYYWYNFTPNGDMTSFVTLNDNGGIVPPEKYDENFDYEAFMANQKTSFMYCKHDESGKITYKTPVTGLELYKDEYGNINVYSVTEYSGKVLFCLSDSTVLVLNQDGSVSELYLPQLEDDQRIYRSNFIYDRDGKLILTAEGDFGQDEYSVNVFYEFDAEKGVVGEPLLKIGGNGTVDMAGAVTSGTGAFRLLIPEYDGLFGLKDDGTTEKILDWLDSDITASTIICAGEDRYITFGCNQSGNDSKPYFDLLTRRPMSEVENTQIITMASLYDNSGGDLHVSEFNKSQSKYRVKFVDYNQYNDDYSTDGAMKQLHLDIIAGKAPDIIVTSDLSTIRSLSGKGAFVDLYELMENDSEVNRKTLMPNMLSALESPDGSLYTLAPSFSTVTLAAKTSLYNKKGWTFDDMFEFYNNAPDTADHLYDYETKEEKLSELLAASGDFVDYEKGTCSFDRKDFINLLEFCDRFADKIETPDKETEYEALGQYYYEKFMAWSQNRTIVEKMSPGSYSYTRYILAKDEITFVGYPSKNGKGGRISFETLYAVSNTCPDKQGAWEFLRTYFLPDYQNSESSYGTPALKSSYEKILDDGMHFTDPFTGESVEYIEDDGDKYYPTTQEERDMLDDYMAECDTILYIDPDISDICMEEAGAYFSGECSAQQAAEMIQNRVSILLSESA